MYGSEEEYNASMNGYGEAQAQYESDMSYQFYLDNLVTSGDLTLYVLERALDMLNSNKFKSSGLDPLAFISREKEYHIKLKDKDNPPTDFSSDDELPF